MTTPLTIAKLMYPDLPERQVVEAERIGRIVEGWSDRMAIDYLVELEISLRKQRA